MLHYTNSNVAHADSESLLEQSTTETDMLEDMVVEWHTETEQHADSESLCKQSTTETDMALETTEDMVATWQAETEQQVDADSTTDLAGIEDHTHDESDDYPDVNAADDYVGIEDGPEVDVADDYVDARDRIEGEMFDVADHQLCTDENRGEANEQINHEQTNCEQTSE